MTKSTLNSVQLQIVDLNDVPNCGQRFVQQEVMRNFRPSDIDLDALAQAIRLFLSSGSVTDHPGSDLPLRRHRVSHVVGGRA